MLTKLDVDQATLIAIAQSNEMMQAMLDTYLGTAEEPQEQADAEVQTEEGLYELVGGSR